MLSEITWQNSQWSVIKNTFNDWLMAQRLDPLILFEAIWLAKTFLFLLLDAFISYAFLCTKTCLEPMTLLFGVLAVLCPRWAVGVAEKLLTWRGEKGAPFSGISLLGKQAQGSWRWRNFLLSFWTVFMYPKGYT